MYLFISVIAVGCIFSINLFLEKKIKRKKKNSKLPLSVIVLNFYFILEVQRFLKYCFFARVTAIKQN